MVEGDGLPPFVPRMCHAVAWTGKREDPERASPLKRTSEPYAPGI